MMVLRLQNFFYLIKIFESTDDYKEKLKIARGQYATNAAPSMFLAQESIDTITDMAARLSIHEDILRAYMGIDDDDKEQYYICALQSESSDPSGMVREPRPYGHRVSSSSNALAPASASERTDNSNALAAASANEANLGVALASASAHDCGKQDEYNFIQQLETVTKWFNMEDVNYVPPPNIASRKANPLHRDKLSEIGEVSLSWHALVARQLSRKEVSLDPSYIDALDNAWIKLIKRQVWGLDLSKRDVREYDDVRREAVKKKKQVHFGRTYGFVVIKHPELEKEQWVPKGRVVFIGNRVADQSGFAALFSEQGSSSSHLTAANLLDAIGHMPGMSVENADATGAYTQSPMEGDLHVETWITIEPDVIQRLVTKGFLSKAWLKMKRPVAKLYKALEGHPKSGWYWERHCHSKIKLVGFEKIPGWENLFVHRKWLVLINVYVDDFKLAGRGPMAHVWKALRDAGLDIDDPVKYQTYLGTAQRLIKSDPRVLEQQVKAYQTTFTHTLDSNATAPADAKTAAVVVDTEPDDDTQLNDTEEQCDNAIASASASNSTPTEATASAPKNANGAAYATDIWDLSFEDVWDTYFTAAEMPKETAWVKDSVQKYDESRKHANATAYANGDPSRVATAQGSARLGMHFSMPKDMSQIRCYENEMFGFVQQCIDQWCQLAKTNEKDIPYFQTPSIDDHLLTPEDMVEKGKLHDVCSRIVLKILWLTRRVRPDTYWAVNTLARSVSQWTVACDKRLHRLIGYLRWSKNYSLQMTVGNEPKDCVIMYFADADFAGSLKDSKSTSGGYMMLLGPQTFVPIAWLCKKQGAVSHSTTEAETISLDAGLRLEALPLLMLWDIVIDVFSTGKDKAILRSRNAGGVIHGSGALAEECRNAIAPSGEIAALASASAPYNTDDLKFPNDLLIFTMENMDWVPPSMPRLLGLARLIIGEDNDAVLKILIKGRNPTFRHVPRTQRVDTDFVHDVMKDKSVSALYINTKVQIADMFTKGSFAIPQWKSLCEMAQVRTTPTKITHQAPVPVEELQPQTPKKKPKPEKRQNTPEKKTPPTSRNASMHSQCGSRKGDVNNCVCTFDVTESFLNYVASAQFIEARSRGYRSYFSVMADDKPPIGGKRRGSPSPAPAVKRLAIDADIHVAKATVSKAPAMAAARKRSISPAVSPSTEVPMQEGSVSTLPPPPPRVSEQSSTMSLASSSNALASASAGDPPKMSPPKMSPPKTAPSTKSVPTGPKHDPRWDLLTESPSTIQSSDATASADAWVSTGLTVEPTPAATPSNWSVDPATGMYQPSSVTKFQNSPNVHPVTGKWQPWVNMTDKPWGATADRVAPSSMLGAIHHNRHQPSSDDQRLLRRLLRIMQQLQLMRFQRHRQGCVGFSLRENNRHQVQRLGLLV